MLKVLRKEAIPGYLMAYNEPEGGDAVATSFSRLKTTKTSVHGAINMLGLAKRLKVRILQSSTSEVYGDPVQHPQTESYWGNVSATWTTSSPG